MEPYPHNHQAPQGPGPAPLQQNSSGMSGVLKAFIILGVIFGVCGLICVAGGVYFAMKLEFDVAEDPVRAAEISAEILEVEVPAGMEPVSGIHMDVVFVNMKMAFYEDPITGADVAFAEIHSPMLSPDEMEQEIRQSMEEELALESDVMIRSMERRDFEVRGETMPFQFVQGELRETGEPVRQVSGAFPATRRGGMSFLMYSSPEEFYDEPAAIAMIKSIR